MIYGQTRILFTMARDGMMPELFHKVNPRTRTPVPNTIIVAAVIALLAGLIPINFLAEMTSVGTLVAFAIVSIAVIVLRRREPDLPRTFKVPGYPVTPILAILGCLWIIKDLLDHAPGLPDLDCGRDRLVFRVRQEAFPPRPARACRIDQG